MHKTLSATLLLLCCFCAGPLLAQQPNDEAAVLHTVDAFFLALGARDKAALEALTFPGSLNISVNMGSDGANSLGIRNYEQLIAALSRPGGAQALERYWDATVLIQGDIAVFWAPYDFHVDGEFSHCGIDSFQFIRQQGEWLISNLSWTLERENCPVSPLGAVP